MLLSKKSLASLLCCPGVIGILYGRQLGAGERRIRGSTTGERSATGEEQDVASLSPNKRVDRRTVHFLKPSPGARTIKSALRDSAYSGLSSTRQYHLDVRFTELWE